MCALKYIDNLFFVFAQSAGAVEHTDSFCAEG